ncbi:hypothetical protein Drose_02775 [Dactylosporangium roseum]|uniref:Gram-positive cocci surface proteins LPxTG domain-containing protein n=1 Tax=Dactylosporangium roseum TaxID=47989 RepID=A0ABY5Z880_9ACTN|nr:hypothetical protein [Dactylosporangium roseum]UWZ37243.1 hypothetical protein Drose_02775 [Dactylosporangium roseum]
MTEPVAFARPKTARYLAALATLGIVGALSPVAFAAPAAAAPANAGCPDGFGATAASNTIALGGIDLRSLGINLPRLPELRVATAHSGFAGGPARAAADARYVQGVLPTGILSPVAYQQAPPPNDRPVTVPMRGVDLGALSVGTGGLSAHATWKDAGKCDPGAGPRSTAEAQLAGLAVLPGRGGRALVRFGAVHSSTVTGVDKDGAGATATGGIADFQLLASGSSGIGVRVISPPRLKVVAGNKKAVDYTAPVLEVTAPGRSPVRLSSAGSHIDVVVPVDAAGRAAAEDLGRAEGLPVAGLPLLDLLTGVTSTLTGSLGGVTGAVPESLLNLPGLPEVGKLTGVLGGGTSVQGPTESTTARPAKVVVLRVELGKVEQQTSATGVYAKAASVRVKLIVRTKWKSASDGYGNDDRPKVDQATVLDLGVCSLEAAAAAPKGGGYGDDDDDDGYGGGVGGGNGGGGTLPVTGPGVGIVLGAGLLLLVAGRFFLIMSRRRNA